MMVATPISSLYRAFYARAIYPAYHWAIRSGAIELIRELDRHDSFSIEELKSLEAAKLETLLAHAKSTVPYYRDLIPEDLATSDFARVTDKLRQVPVLTKQTIRERKDDLVSQRLAGNRLDPNSTSGSTGEPLTFYTDLWSKSHRKAVVVRNRKWVGISVGDPVARLWGAEIDTNRARSMRGRMHSLVTRELMLSAYQLADDDMESYAIRIRKHNARLLIGYPSVLQKFGSFCRERGFAFPALKAIICSAEALLPSQRQSIEADFSVPLYNRYGCREVGDIAQEIPGQEGLVVNSDRIHVEIVDESGKPCAPGVIGDIIITDLDNFGMPLIRYRIGDRGCWASQSPGESRKPYPVLEAIEGRSLDVVVCPSGNRIGGTFWTILMRGRPGIESFRVIQESLYWLKIEYKRAKGVAEIDTAYFRQKIAERCGSEVRVEFVEKASIEARAGDKFRLVRSDVVSDG